MDAYHSCDLCGLNRATLHLDETVEGVILATAHLCDDCWYRLGIRIPLGNIWHHIQEHQRSLEEPPSGPPLEEEEEILEKEEIEELLDPGALAVAEPKDEKDDEENQDIEEALLAEENVSPRREDLLDIDELLDEVEETAESSQDQPIGIEAVHVDRVHPTLISLFPRDMLLRSKAIPVKLEGCRLTVALADPFDKIAVANLEVYIEKLGFAFVQAFADEEDILRELNRHGGGPSNRFESLS